MRINYKILWVEDDKDYFESLDQELLASHLEEKGFELTITPCHEIPVDQYDEVVSKAKQVDLIVMDFVFAGRVASSSVKSGSDLIEQIRQSEINTEVVFYSSKGAQALREEVFKKELDGVFCRDRRDIESKLLPIIDSTIRKILDLENFRGLVLAEVSDLEHLLSEILKSYFNSKDEARKSFLFKKMKGSLTQDLDTKRQILENNHSHVQTEHFEGILTQLDFSKKFQTAISICKKESWGNLKSELNKYFQPNASTSIILPRNLLAHVSPLLCDEGYKFSGLNGKEWVLTEETGKEFRRNLIGCRNVLTKLKSGLPPTGTAND